jgi:MFS transporter, AAHS family, 3-hydroxyphenylpropionic acid transporter
VRSSPAVHGGRPNTITILFCVLAALCEGIDLQAAGVAAAGIGAEFKPTPDQFGTFFSASTFGLFLGAVIGGRLADSIGRKKVLVTSIGLFGLFSLLTSFALDVPSLIWVRALTGLGLGGTLPTLLALVTESSQVKHQSANVAMVYAAMPLGGAGASLLIMLIATSHWRTIFLVGGVFPLLLAPLMAIALPESTAFQRARQDSATLRGGSLTALFADGRALCTSLLWASFLLELLLLYLLLNWLPTLLLSDGFTQVEAAGAQIGFNLGGVLSAVLMGFLLGGRLRNLAIAATFLTLPILLVLLAKSPPDFSMIASAVFLLGCAVLAAHAFLYALAPVAYPTRIRGMGVGAAVAVGRIGSIAGPKLGGALKAAGHAPSRLLMDLLPVVIIGSLCALWLAWEVERRKSLPRRADPRSFHQNGCGTADAQRAQCREDGGS